MHPPNPYVSYIEKDSEARRLLDLIPWALIGSEQENISKVLVNEYLRFQECSDGPLLSIVTPMYNTPVRLLQELIFSCRAQSWQNWELLLVDDKSPSAEHISTAENAAASDSRIRVIRSDRNRGIGGARNLGISHAKGDWFGFLDHDDLLHPQALGVFAREILDSKSRGTKINFIFSNECKITEDSTKLRDFFYKPRLCPSTLLRSNYVAHLTFIERNFLEKNALEDGSHFSTAFDGVEDHEFFLRLARTPDISSVHLTEFCYYWRIIQNSTSHSLDAKPYVHERGLELIKKNLSQHGTSFRIDDLAGYTSRNNKQNRFLRCAFSTTRNLDHRVVVLVPFRNKIKTTLACLESLETQDIVLDVILIDNGSDLPVAEQLLDWTKRKRKHKYLLEPFAGPFNFGRINNQAFQRHSAGYEFVLFLNNDVVFTEQHTVRQMAGAFDFDSGIGFCGIRLMFPDQDRVQHGGIKFGLETFGPCYFRPRHMDSMTDFVFDDHVVTAVTFACAMTKVSTYLALGGLDERWVPNGFGDIDIGLRAMNKGFRNFYLGSATAVHHEGVSRGPVDESLELSKLYENHGGIISQELRRQLGYDNFLSANKDRGWIEKPLRYRLVDKINDTLKSLGGPVHRLLRKQLHG